MYFSNSTLSSVLVAFFLIFNVVSAGAQVCGTSGIDGPQNAVPPVNTYFPLSPTASLPAGSQTITLNAVPPNDPNYNLSYGITPIKSGDLILIIQMQDASFDYTNSNLYGAGSATSGPDNLGGTGYTNLNNSGKFEYVVATNDVPITGGTLEFRGGGVGSGCVNTYTNANATGARGQRRFQVVRVPQYSNLVLTANITTPPYNGSVGGLIAFDVAGTMQFNGFIVDASARGFRGGYGPRASSGANINSFYVGLSSSTLSVGKGEGVGGTPQFMWDGFNQVNNGIDGLPGGSYGKGAPANGGGGGNDHNAGGGGGGNGGSGGVGGRGWEGHSGTNTYPNGGRPGSNITALDPAILVMGGGGGGGDANDALSGVTGGVGGGIVLINVEKIDGFGVIKSNGGNGAPGTFGSSPDGAGGGGAGGTIFVRSLSPSPLANLTLEAKGGRGGNSLNDNNDEHGPGGGGGGGFIYTQIQSAAIAKDVSKGLSGRANNGAGISHGAADGTDGQTKTFTTTDLPVHLQGGGSICYPVLTTTLTEENPGAAGARTAGTTATYTLTIQNAPTNGNAGNVEAWLNLPSSFKVSSISYALTGDAAGTLDATPHIGASGIMNFGNFNISPGDKVVITIVVDIALNAPTGVYHASAQASYLDPTRTNLNPFRKITGSADPFTGYNTTYESGNISNVIGTNYNGNLLSATAEDVYINALAVTGSCDAITGGGFESYTPGDYPSIDKWLPVNSGDVVKIVTEGTSKGAAIKKNLYSLKQQIQSVESSTNYTINLGLRRWTDNSLGCNPNSNATFRIRIYDPSNPSVYFLDQTESTNNNNPAPLSFSFVTSATTTSIVFEMEESNSGTVACPLFVDDISIVSNLNLIYNVTNVTCNGANNGKVTLSLLTGAAAPYQVSYSLNGGSYTSPTALNPINNSGTPLVFPNLIPGNYEAKIVDANGCVNTRSFNITEPPVLALSETHIDNSCNNNSIGAIDLTVTGGTAPYTYDWKKDGVAYAATQDISSLPPGSYTVSVTDNNSCLKQLSVDILPLTPFALTGSQTNIVCNGSATGAITLNPSGGKAPYSFDWSNASHDQNQTNLIAGNYTVIGKDALGCEIALSFTLSEPPLLTITGTATPILCNGDKSTVTLTAGGGTGSYQYSIDGGANYQSSATFNNLSGGNYTFYVKDANGCIKTFDSAIAEPTLLTLTGSNTPILCYGYKSTVTLSGGGGTGTYQYSIDGTNYQASAIFGNLSGGDYTFYIKDANNCIKTLDIAIAEPALLTVNETHQNINCFGDATGEISVAIIGGTAPYSFTWSNGETSLNQSNLPAGTYTLDVTDANNCTTSKSITITQPPVISIAFSRVNVKCFGQATGSINATISGGTAPYTFEWSNGATSEDVNNLLAGSYSLVVSDANGCLGFASLNITQPPVALTLTETHINNTCFSQNAGYIDLNVSGGVSPYIYSWSSGESTQDLSGLAPGNYTVTVTDANLCTADKTITITPLTPFTLTSSKIDVKCNGADTGEIVLNLSGGTLPYNIIWSNGATTAIVQNLIAGTYTYTATDGNGCQISNTITITEPAALTTTKAQTDVLCFGSATGAIDITATGGTGSYTYVWDNGKTDEDLTGLTAGTYKVIVTDANGCQATETVTIAQPAGALSISKVQTDVLCFGDNTGAIDITATGGTGSYTYVWDNGKTDEDLTGLTAGTYEVTVTDANGCTATTSIQINQPMATLTLTSTKTDVLCFGDNTGAIDITATGGTGSYTYVWDNGKTDEDLTGLTAGTYKVIVTDANGCQATETVTIAQPAGALSISKVQTDVLCFGENTGAIDITATGGTGSYTYVWDNGKTDEDLTGLTAGTYEVTVTDANGCTATTSIQINQPMATLTLTSTKTDVLCFGDNTGAIDITATGGTGSYTYVWDNGKTDEDLTGLTAGTYKVIVTDANGCQATETVTIAQPAGALSISKVQTDVLCFGDNTGAIDITATGGTGSYTYVWDNGKTDEDLTGLTAGTYEVTVTDANGCTATTSIQIAQPSAPLSLTSTKTDVKCYGDNTGAIDITATGGTGSYTYVWDNGKTDEDLTALVAGTYKVTVTDANGCTATETVTIAQPSAPLSLTSIKTDVKCYGDNTGAIDITATGGTGSYTYIWNNGKTGEDLTGLTAGTYQVTVTDANGCQATETVTITQPAVALSISKAQTDVLCFGENTGAIDITATGGTGSYTYVWDNGKTDEDLTGLTAGTYKVIVTDANGCQATETVTIAQPAGALSISKVQTDVLCFGDNTGAIDITATGGTGSYTYVWDNGKTDEDLTGLTAGTYEVTVTDANGCTATTSIQINQPMATLTLTSTKTDVLCFGDNTGAIDITATGGTGSYTYVWDNGKTDEDLTGLTAGTYKVIVTDANGCQATETVTIAQPAGALSISKVQTDVLCFGENTGAIDITATGGTGSYTYVWDNGKTDEDLTGLTAGTYEVTVTDANGCTATTSIQINQPMATLTLTSTKTDVLCFGDNTGAIDITATGGTGSYTYVWDNGKTDEDLTGLTAGTYKVIVTDANGCQATETVTIAQPAGALSISKVQTDVLCFGDNTGAIDITATGGTGSYTYVWDNGKTDEDLTGLTAGTYEVTVTDANGCTATTSIQIAQPSAPLSLTSTKTDVKCYGDNTGAIDITATGGTGSYTYVWDNGKTDEDLTGLTAGTYEVTVTDANGCTATTSIQINQPMATLTLTSTKTDVLCFGDNTGAIDITATGGTGSYTYIWNNGKTGEDLTGLTAGTYQVTVTDANGCQATETVTITQPAVALSISKAQTDVLCFGENTGAIDITATGGTGSYTYVWDNGKTTEDLTALTAGTYEVTVTDANGCQATETVTIAQPSAPLSLTSTKTDVLCFGDNTGAIDITATGGTGSYTYVWDNGRTTEDLTALTAGTYEVTVTDANGCQATATVTITQPSAPLSLTGTKTDVKCFGDNTGAIDITATGGTGSYTYVWDNGKTGEDLTGLTAGTYKVIVTDANGCQATETVTITQPAGVLTISKAQTDVKCFGENTGAIDITATGGTGSYTYVWDNGKTDEDLTALVAGTYKVTVTDANGCTATTSIQIAQPAGALSISKTQTDVKCYGDNTGAIDITATGGTGSYTYVWDNGKTDEDLTGLTAGTCQVTVTDANGCTATETVTIAQPSAPLSLSSTKTDVKCFGENTGAIDITATGGTGSYTYVWDNGKTDEDLTALTAGTYKVTVTDSNGCTATETVTINQPMATLTLTSIKTDVKCFGDNTGAIDITATGGTGSYTYVWDNGKTGEDLTGLTAGTYQVTVTDANGCTATTSIQIAQPSAPLSLTGTKTDVKCFGDNTGAIDITATGGTGSYTYVWDNGRTTEDLTGLTAGTYEVTVTDANGCQATETVTITQPSASLSISENHTNVKCYGSASGSINISVSGGKAPYVYSWSNGAITQNLSALEAGDYTLTVKDANNCLAAITITISQPLAPLTLVENHEDILCYGDATGSITLKVDGGTAPYSYLWTNNKVSKDLSGLKAGIYAVTITDAKGCTIGTQIQISQPAAPLSITETHQNVACFGTNTGSIAINVLGGTAPYTYEWSNGVEIQNLDNLFAGDYEVKVTDKNGCTVIKKIQITQPVAPLALSETHVNNGCYSDNIGKITLTATGGVTPYTYQWSNGATTKNLASLAPGVYQVVVTDKNGCTQTLSVEILPIKPFIVKTELEQIKCFGDNSGKINLQLSGGEAPYQVSWSNGTTGLSLQNLAPGNYTYSAKDALGCVQTKTITINQPQPLSAKAEVKNTSCKYSPDGAIKLNVLGGTQPYRFVWNGTDRGQNSSLINVNAGKYDITIIDANNCLIQLSAEILPGNCAPSADNDKYQTIEDNPIIIKTPGIIINDIDPDDDDLRVTLGSAKDPEGQAGEVEASKTVFKTRNGKVSLNNDGSFTYTPNKNFFGTEYFIYEVTDGELKSNFAQVTIVVTEENDPPVANDDFFNTTEDTPVNGSVTTNDSDPEGDPLSYIITNPPSSGNLTLNPDGTFIYTPDENYNGTVTFDYQVCDPEGLCDQATATIVVIPVNDAPIAGEDKFSLQRNGQISETVTSNDSDADGDLLQFTQLSNPANGTLIFNPDGTFIYQPNTDFKGIDQFTYTTCDPSGLCDDASVTLVVQPIVTVNLVPREATINEGDSIKITAVLTESLVEDVIVYLNYSGTAMLNNDYVLTDNYLSLLIPANQTETNHYFSINTILDDIKDDNESVISNITSTSKPAFVNIGTNSTVLIKDVYPESVTNTPSENPDINPDPLVSPNGDGLGNETFVIYNISKYPNNEVVIFNRWGNKVYETRGYDNKGNSFKGIANVGILTNSDKELVDGVYYYLIYTDEDNKRKLNKGYLILKR